MPQTVRDEMKFVFCERVDDVAREALGIKFNTAVTAAAPEAIDSTHLRRRFMRALHVTLLCELNRS